MSAATYRINGKTYRFVRVNPVYWLLEDADGVLWRAYGPEIRPKMRLARHEATS